MRLACCETQQLFVFTKVFSAEERALRPRLFRDFSSLLAQKHLSTKDTCWKHRQMCGFSWKAQRVDGDRKKEEILNFVCVSVCLCACVWKLCLWAGDTQQFNMWASGWGGALRIPSSRRQKYLAITWNASSAWLSCTLDIDFNTWEHHVWNVELLVNTEEATWQTPTDLLFLKPRSSPLWHPVVAGSHLDLLKGSKIKCFTFKQNQITFTSTAACQSDLLHLTGCDLNVRHLFQNVKYWCDSH